MLAKHFGITAHDALHVRPAWEIDNLIARHLRDQREQADG